MRGWVYPPTQKLKISPAGPVHPLLRFLFGGGGELPSYCQGFYVPLQISVHQPIKFYIMGMINFCIFSILDTFKSWYGVQEVVAICKIYVVNK